MIDEKDRTCHRPDNHDPSSINASQAKSLTTFYIHIDQVAPNVAKHMTNTFARNFTRLSFHTWLFDTKMHEKPFEAFQNAREEINEPEYTAATIARFITQPSKKRYTSIAAEPREEALRFSNPERQGSFDDYVMRIKEICEEAITSLSDNQPVIAQALLDNNSQVYGQAIHTIVTSDLRVIAVTTDPTTTIENLKQTRPDLYPM